jgi:hypothetical protein
VKVVLGRVAARIEGEQTAETANSKPTPCSFAPQEDRMRKLAQEEAVRMRREIELRFVKTEKMELAPE